MKRKQLTDKVKSLAKEMSVPAELVRRYYVLEKILELISTSKYKEKFMLKGGFLIGSYIGLKNRTTVDIDASVRDMNLTKDEIFNVFQDLFEFSTKDGIKFRIVNIKEIREGDFYPGFRVQVNYDIDGIKDGVKLDITTGDRALPELVLHRHQLMFEDEQIEVYAYSIEQILGEKLQTIFDRSVLNTRSRDYYDIYVFTKFHSHEMNYSKLRKSFFNTMESRKTVIDEDELKEILKLIETDERQNELWENYARQYSYAKGVTFNEVLKAIYELLNKIRNDES
ncbi:nucleotidyl transferase AbiEii/AbiGii toxin family protein [Tetragenococcus koreensis]|uniref:nucleotidyl transferase AbiEii/AbiGii toxin family protein n=1 Tax=Tetragenococcus koreensis TaxID=290335 RepID=UPI001F3A62DD|nr:nucleotidyl transferase AbiEii/AbiGii toxin family protein [Tetragenococcus koreensis]MCF1585315.1 nucleotidyl transferase AbiEii/AbiGii toxin family protein [Tetragenococcus koreensis]MCF1614878.1 nucleotidyl transferase AbiEii/AbiGii toxin family protein [Tetragenococcus koreensis]MCF1618885.1 nucleotidyl transferase AbiEii/AbiGii toxin family protein [Tetragenococcus koreensis]MCF1624727.1 nucleotidyl transferase AbiEii/AbiGii toxin family protein [Tetragenococcus koreensis]MCF1629558.1 